ncbi:MAG: hypothetical protein B7Y25_03110 [Alphaproteobacteria bacterium 16-39-46]|nr:MAG: hypothetical protein B7Y25_03110 [Alphaproteobacteria bacterium 16-39-46]OZA43403.1 MAG: hypothetical protein B7X84_03310 [Alphaproteobacteria bacterium 17-39-52]HQS83892.1 non-canonical purine NTP pyrophosphatase [Alphaproteobacteria bacterium]HQS93719.1 non-canonical purine NTP pyrophosphatase [Alphaproteobacteria bacterium]
MIYKIIIASTNKDKIKEISKIFNSLKNLKIEINSLQDSNIPEPKEPHDSFLMNAIHKAKYYAQHTKNACLSEDSGLSIEALNGFPGIKSKDLIEEEGGTLKTFIKLKKMLSNYNNYSAYFSSAAVLYIPAYDFLIMHEAKNYGYISFPPRGNTGFGYDPIFIPNGYNRTFAELGTDIKNKISHRNKSIIGLTEKLEKFLNQ